MVRMTVWTRCRKHDAANMMPRTSRGRNFRGQARRQCRGHSRGHAGGSFHRQTCEHYCGGHCGHLVPSPWAANLLRQFARTTYAGLARAKRPRVPRDRPRPGARRPSTFLLTVPPLTAATPPNPLPERKQIGRQVEVWDYFPHPHSNGNKIRSNKESTWQFSPKTTSKILNSCAREKLHREKLPHAYQNGGKNFLEKLPRPLYAACARIRA